MSKVITKLREYLCTSIVFIAYFNVHNYSIVHSYLREFCEQVSQIVFFADLTVLQLITTVWGKMSQILYLPEFIEQVSQIVFLAYFTVLGLFKPLYKEKCHKTHIYASSVNKYHKSCFLFTSPF